MKTASTPQAQKENMAKFIQSHATDHLNNNQAGKNTQNMPAQEDMDITVDPPIQSSNV